MEYCKDTRAMMAAMERRQDEIIFQLQRKVYELQCRVFDLELERYLESYKKRDT